MNDICVSVLVLAYNHEKYIRDCLDGILCQKVDFKYELIIHDDASTDNTVNIIREYERQYPDIIEPIYQEQNQYSQGKKILMTFVYPRAKGKYIALCEGDDYWTDPNKLQKQFDFMEAHDDVSMTFHDATIVDSKHKKITTCSRYFRNRFVQNESVIINGGGFCPTASLMFKTKYVQEGYPYFCLGCHVGDHPLQLFLATKGRVYYFTSKMSVYRLASNDTSWTVQFAKSGLTSEKIKSFKTTFVMLDGINGLFDGVYSKTIQKANANYFIYIILYPAWKNSTLLLREFDDYIKEFNSFDKLKIKLFVRFFPLLWISKNYYSVKRRITQFFIDVFAS